MSNDPLLTYQDCAAYFRPAKHVDTIRDWLKAARVKVFRPTKRTICVRKSVWEKFLARREQKINSTSKRGRK